MNTEETLTTPTLELRVSTPLLSHRVSPVHIQILEPAARGGRDGPIQVAGDRDVAAGSCADVHVEDHALEEGWQEK